MGDLEIPGIAPHFRQGCRNYRLKLHRRSGGLPGMEAHVTERNPLRTKLGLSAFLFNSRPSSPAPRATLEASQPHNKYVVSSPARVIFSLRSFNAVVGLFAS